MRSSRHRSPRMSRREEESDRQLPAPSEGSLAARDPGGPHSAGVGIQAALYAAAPRYNEALLIRELEEKGIGRPSTYAAIISTIQDRKYVENWRDGFCRLKPGGR